MSNSSMSPEDLAVCRHALSVLKSDKHKGNNYIFMDPVDTTIFTTYLDIVKRPMDLRTLGENLESNKYPSRREFFQDARQIFHNAQVFHKGKKETAWIIKLANAMLKVVAREEKAADKKLSQKVETKKAPSLKLKLSTSKTSSSSAASTATATATSKPKLSIKLGGSKSEAPAPAPAPKPAPKAKKPKLKLSLSSKTKKSTAAAPPPVRAPSRGKELPKGVSVAPPATSKPSRKQKSTTKPKVSSGMPEDTKASCFKVLNGLKRREPQNVVWFLKPISDKMVVDDYRAKIPHPMDIGTMTTKLERGDYATPLDFIKDVRRTFGNCLRYNTSVKDGFRPVAMEMQSTSEELIRYFLPNSSSSSCPLLYCWKLCVSVLDALLNLTNPHDGHQTAHYFLHPVSFFCGGNFPADYLKIIQKPMDFGTVTSNLMEGVYTSVAQFCTDCKLVLQNCITYYAGKQQEGQLFVGLAKRLEGIMTQQLDALVRYDGSPRGERAKLLYESSTPTPPTPPPELLLGILGELRHLTYTDKFTKLSEPATRSFEKPVDLQQNPDYLKFVKTPMDLGTIEARVRGNTYKTLEDFEYDASLVFRNAEAYNVPRRNDHMVSVAKFCNKNLRKIISNRLKGDTDGTEETSGGVKREAPTAGQSQGTSKKARVEAPGKAVPRISISSAAVAASKTMDNKTNRAKSPKASQLKANQEGKPVPLHVAIAQVKERFPLRRPLKYLEPWEAACSRFFRELMKHPWISAARPKFIFVVPVPVLFPDLQEAYTAKIRKPMDLTTCEAKLLQGGLYRGPQDMVDDVALVFSNAIVFNRTGKDTGDLLSSAYYDASVQLLRYSRWLSLEVLSQFLINDSSPTETPPEGEPTLMSWKLTVANKKSAREEMESIVLNEAIEKSIEGDRYTWMESECEKLLKSLRHQSDAKKMQYFIMPEYPADYAAFISKPMDYVRVNRRLQNREYDTFGEIISDLRLIFSNALRYNERAKGTETVSGYAYDGAIYMSEKLEAAIDKMMISVSDRVEREKIEHNIAEREIEAAERAEEEKMRAQWTGSSGAKPADSTETIETVRFVSRRPPKRRERARDFDSYFEEDESSHEQSYIDAMKLQKMISEKQKMERAVLKNNAIKVGTAAFARLQHRKSAAALSQTHSATEPSGVVAASHRNQMQLGSSALEELDRSDRSKIKIALPSFKKPGKKTSKKRKRSFKF